MERKNNFWPYAIFIVLSLLTGGLARSEYVVSRLRERIGFLAPIRCFPGEDEMEALAMNALAVLRGKREAKEYK